MPPQSRTIGDVCGLRDHQSWARNALKRPNLCARCYSITVDAESLRHATSEEGFALQVPLRILYDSAESSSCRMCSIFLCLALHSLRDESYFTWLVVKFLDAHGAATASLKVRALLQPKDLRKSTCDIHELLLYGGIIDAGISARDLMDSHLRFKVYALPGDQAASYIGCMECDRDMNSSAAYSKVRSWMADCDSHHSSCPRPVPTPLPTRVIDVQNQDVVRIQESKGERGQYAALSYCWGSGQQSETTQSFFDDACTHIPVSSLPLTIQDAVTVTKQIGLKYLWVDALCIIQDSIEDRDAEIGQMAQYYQNSSVTIIAANSSGSDKGFLAPKASPRSLEPDSVPYQFQLPLAFPDGKVGVVGVEYCQWDNGTSPEPLDRRAWAYQEHILCRRALTYGTSTLTWRCELGMQTWNSWLREHQKVVTKLLPKRGDRYLYKDFWAGMVAIYGRRKLTFPEDKLPAISALASHVFRLSIENGGEPGRYLAGLWENDMLNQLIWFADPGESRDVRCIPYRAPSWSWASVECPIIFPNPRSGLSPGELENTKGMELEVLDCSVTPRSGLVPLGQVTGGRLKVRGCLIHGASVPGSENWLLGTFRGATRDVVLKLDCYGVGDRAAISKAQSCWWLLVQHRHGLVLEHVGDAVYRRVGCVVIENWSELSVERRVVDVI